MGATTPKQLASKRPYVIVGAFIVGMLLTPPDVISQILLAIPVWLLFELGLFLARVTGVKKEDETDTKDSTKKEPRFGPLNDEEQEVEINETELLNDSERPTD